MKKSILLILTLLCSKLLFADVIATLDNYNPKPNSPITLTIDTSNNNATPDVKVLDQNFYIIYNQQISQTTIINGQINPSGKFIFVLLPKNVGKQQIPAIKVGDETTNAIEINVDNSTHNSAVENTIHTSVGHKEHKELVPVVPDIIFKAQITNEPNYYVNVPIVYTLSVYMNKQFSNLSLQPFNFQHTNIIKIGELQQDKQNIHGTLYNVMRQKFLLIPNEDGEFYLESPILTGQKVINPTNINQMMLGFTVPFSITAESAHFTVHNIPNQFSKLLIFPAKAVDVTESFSSESNIYVGTPIYRTINITAAGIQANIIPDLTFNAPNTINVYPAKVIPQDDINGIESHDQIKSSKTFSVTYIANKAGDFYLPAIKFNWYDITRGIARTITIPEHKIHIINNPSITSPNRQNTPTTSLKHKPIQVNKYLHKKQPQPQNNILFYGIIILASIIIFSLIYVVVLKYNNKKQVITSSSANRKSALNAIRIACDNQDNRQLSVAIVNWANIVFSCKLHNISEVPQVLNNENTNKIIKQLNESLYYKGEFNNYSNIYMVFLELDKTLNHKVNKKVNARLESFYPNK
jgi:hypothetical protein